MHPILLTLGPFTVYSYGVALVAAYLLGTCLAIRHARRLPPTSCALPPDQVTDVCLAGLLSGILGGRLFYILAAWEYFRNRPLEWPAIWHGGLVWYGGFFGGLLGSWWYVRRRHLAFLPVVDQLIPVIALGHALGRLGCFFNGCCYGVPTQAWYGVQFPGHATAVVPTQLMEAGGLVLLAALLWWRQRRPARPGQLFGLYLMGYALLRAAVEVFRGDQPRVAGWTLPQCISFGLAAAGLVLWVRSWRGRTSSR